MTTDTQHHHYERATNDAVDAACPEGTAERDVARTHIWARRIEMHGDQGAAERLYQHALTIARSHDPPIDLAALLETPAIVAAWTAEERHWRGQAPTAPTPEDNEVAA